MLDIRPLSEELEKVAIEQMGEVPTRIPEYMKALKDWLATQPHLKARTDDQFLIQFLRCCKYNMGKVKALLDLYFSLKTKYPEMYNATNVDDRKFRTVSRWGSFMSMPVPLHDNGPRIIPFKFDYPTKGFTIENVFQAFIAMHEIMIMHDPYACIHGIIYIVDFSQATPTHFQHLSPEFSKKLYLFRESVPLCIKSIIYLNLDEARQDLIKDVFPRYSEEMRKRLVILDTNGVEKLKDMIPLKYLPSDFDGEQPSLVELAGDYDGVWNANREFIKENTLYGTNESLRPHKPFDVDSFFEANGAFKSFMH